MAPGSADQPHRGPNFVGDLAAAALGRDFMLQLHFLDVDRSGRFNGILFKAGKGGGIDLFCLVTWIQPINFLDNVTI